MKELVKTRPFEIDVIRKFASDGRLYAILDACNEPEIPGKVAELGKARAKCLFRKVDDPKTLAVAPYLAHLGEEDVDWLSHHMWHRFWGIFAIADSSLKALRTHFRKFLMVELENGGAVYFRYYDPRVLETFLPTCDEKQLKDFYGPVHAYGVPSKENQVTREVLLLTPA